MVREPWFSQPMVTLIGKNLSLVSTTLYFDTNSTGDWFADSKEADSKEGHHTQEGAVCAGTGKQFAINRCRHGPWLECFLRQHPGDIHCTRKWFGRD